jgi:cellulose synthase/poly-beta-1,6-N-acetylglucosamine synthase-like glycosyltransferase/peptidoglycan/xylan/chitin deacetylase (PgdA/CDA1 family)
MTIERARLRRSRSERGRQLARRIERPPAHWLLLAVFIATLAFLLLAEGLTVHTTGAAGTPPPPSSDRKAALKGNAALWVAGPNHQLIPRERPVGHRVALTFDDGPDPRWTPEIAAVLKRFDVPATFFEIGERIIQNPGVTSDLHNEGFEIGNHTFSHVDLARAAGFRELQISLTESAISGAAGIRARFVRPPYSATPDAVDLAQEKAYWGIARHGYVIALANYDSEDWRRPGVDEIIRNATPPGNHGGVLMFHDGGGDRSETLAALERLIPELRARGFQFVGLGELLGAGANSVDPPATSSQHVRGEMLIGSLTAARLLTDLLAALLLPVMVLAILRAIAVVVLARAHARRRGRQPRPTGFHPPVSLIVPAYNEATGIEKAVRSLAASEYPTFEVIVVDDGSTDGTGELVDRLRLPNVRVIKEPNRGKPEALNTALAASKHDVIVAVDADTLFAPGTLAELVRPFADPQVGAVAGNAKVGNRRSLLGLWQHIDYVTGFNLDRRIYDLLGCMPTVPGAVGAFRKGPLLELGGFSSDTLAEDTDVTIALSRRGWKVVYEEEAKAFTEVPSSLGGLWRQRYRWSFGTMQSVWKHRRAIGRRTEGPIGTIGLPSLIFFQIALPLLAPLIDLFALYGLIFLSPLPVLGFWIGFNVLMLAQGAYAFHLDGERPWPLWALPLQTFVYRQLMYLVVLQSVISAVQGLRLRWSHVERSGDVEIAASPSPSASVD